MTIIRAFLITFLLIFIANFIHLVFLYTIYLFDNYGDYFSIINATSVIISYLTGYLLVFKFFWDEKIRINKILKIKEIDDHILYNIVLIVIGLHLFDKPLLDMENIFNYFFNSELKSPKQDLNNLDGHFLIRSISILFIAPVFEELFFRRFLFKKLSEKYSLRISLVISSVLFSLFHWETPHNLIPTFLFGIISGIVFISTKRIAYSILLHFLFNFLIQLFFISDFPLDYYFDHLRYNSIYWIICLFGGVLVYAGTIRIIKRHN